MHATLLPSLLGAALLAPAAVSQAPATPDAWGTHRAIRVLYAGWPDGSREKAFAAFLREWFDTVGVIGLGTLSKATAEGYDVVIADWASQYGNDGYPKRENSLYSAPVSLGADFGKPVIAMSYVSSNLRRSHKLDWL